MAFTPGWFHLTTTVNGRAAPGGKITGQGPPGHNFRAVARVSGAGRDWLKSDHGTFYAAEFCKAGKAPTASAGAGPVPGYKATTPWRKRPNNRTYWRARGYHTGTDWAAPKGAKVVALNDGTLVRRGFDSVLGNVALLYYRDRLGRKFTRWYCHLSAVSAAGAVKAGQPVGKVGMTGSGAAMGTHLHLERRAGWTTSWAGVDLDPMAGWAK